MSEVISFRAVLRDPSPPSVNHLYFNGPHGRVLTKEGRAFKDAMKDAVAQSIATMKWKAAVDEVYGDRGYVVLVIRMYRDKLYNESWKPHSKTGSGNARSPYQKLDATNYAKVIEDAVVLGTGIDDSAHLEVTISKGHDPSDPRVEVDYYVYSRPQEG
jgi:Holliday junction resolvase RusA-like endonuclease